MWILAQDGTRWNFNLSPIDSVGYWYLKFMFLSHTSFSFALDMPQFSAYFIIPIYKSSRLECIPWSNKITYLSVRVANSYCISINIFGLHLFIAWYCFLQDDQIMATRLANTMWNSLKGRPVQVIYLSYL